MSEVNKAEAIRKAIVALGGDPKPKAVIEHLQKKGIEVSGAYVSMEKTKIKKASESALIKAPGAAVATAEVASAPAVKMTTQNIVEIILTLKQLIMDVGSKEELKRLIDAL
jgi:hypothetical protein